MARPKEFDPEQATQEAMEAFWEHGYAATSVSDLLAEMGLNRGSLYGTFGDKRRLFLTALERYDEQGRAKFLSILDRPGPAKATIRSLVGMAAETCVGKDGRRGCLAAKAAMEVAPHDPEVAQWLKQVWARNQQSLADAIRRGQAQGEIPLPLDAETAALFLLTSVGGLRLLGATGPSPDQVKAVVELALGVLD